MTLEIGALLYNRYEILDVLAQGGMGAIYRAMDKSLGVVVAVKENLIGSDDSTRQFQQEASILASLRHANLPRVTDHFVLAGQGQYLVMDYIEGEDLKQRITRLGRLQEAEAVLIIVAVCDALVYLHSRTPPIVHRDIKPGNIKIAPSGEVFLVDFGLAKVAKAGQQTEVGAQAYTPGFAPPEQYGKGTDLRSDIYALGATLYAALTGKVPADGLARAMGSAELIPIHECNPNVSKRLVNVIATALEVVPNKRYQTANSFQQALLSANTTARHTVDTSEIRITPFLEAASKERTTSVRFPSQPMPPSGGTMGAPSAYPQQSYYGAPSQPSMQQHSQVPYGSQPYSEPKSRKVRNVLLIVLPLLAVFFLLVIVIGGYFILNGGFDSVAGLTNNAVTATDTVPATTEIMMQTPAEANVVEQSPTVESGEIATDVSATPEVAEVTATLEQPAETPVGGGGKIAFASERGEGGIPQIWLMDTTGENFQQLTELSDGACDPDWSPDGERIVFVSPCRQKQTEYEGSRLFIINADGSNMLPLDTKPGGDFNPSWSPDGNIIAFTSLRSDQRPHIYLYHLDGDSIDQLSSMSAYDRRPVWSPDGQWIAFETSRAGMPEIWYMKADGEDQKEFSRSPQTHTYMPAWSPDGEIILYSQGSNLPWLVGRSFEDMTAVEFKVSDLRPVYDVDFSSDGYWIVFDSIQDVGNRDIYRMMSNGSNMVRLTDHEGADFHPAWQP